MSYDNAIGELRQHGSFAGMQMDFLLRGEDRLAGLDKDFYSPLIMTLEDESAWDDPRWAVYIVKPVLEKQTGKIYRFDNNEFRQDWKESISRLRAVDTFGSQIRDTLETRLAVRFLCNLVHQALTQDFSYKRYVA